MKNIKIKIAVAIDDTGNWAANGWPTNTTLDTKSIMESVLDGISVENNYNTYWIEIDIPVPPKFEQVITDNVEIIAGNSSK